MRELAIATLNLQDGEHIDLLPELAAEVPGLDVLIYAFRVLGDRPGRWYGEPETLPEGSYQTSTIDFNPGPNPSPYAGSTLEVRYGPVPDDGLPAYLQGYTTVNGMRIRATAIVQEELFREPGFPAPVRARSRRRG